MNKGLSFFIVNLFTSSLVFADLVSPPAPFDGHCECYIKCSDAYVSNDPADKSKVEGTYKMFYKIAPLKTVLADNGASLCAAAASVLTEGSALGITGSVSPLEAAIKLCKNGSPEIGYCATEASCGAENVICT